MHMHMHMHMHTYTHTYMHAHTHSLSLSRTHRDIRTRTHTHTHTCTFMCVGTYVFMYVCVCVSIFEYIQRNVHVPDAEPQGHTHKHDKAHSLTHTPKVYSLPSSIVRDNENNLSHECMQRVAFAKHLIERSICTHMARGAQFNAICFLASELKCCLHDCAPHTTSQVYKNVARTQADPSGELSKSVGSDFAVC